jgi:hypothetical protein
MQGLSENGRTKDPIFEKEYPAIVTGNIDRILAIRTSMVINVAAVNVASPISKVKAQERLYFRNFAATADRSLLKVKKQSRANLAHRATQRITRTQSSAA